jgi:hypothetical protein
LKTVKKEERIILLPGSPLKTMDTAISSKTGRRQGATKENILYGSSTEEQRSRRPGF